MTEPAPAPVESAPAPVEAPAPEATLASVIQGIQAPEAEAEPTPEAPAPEASEGKPEPAKPDLFSDSALATKEGIARAREEVRALRAKHDAAYLRVSQREAKFAKSLEAIKAEKAEIQTLGGNVRQALTALRRGTTDQRIEALGTLTGADGLKVFEQLTLDLARGSKRSEPSPEVAELRAELAELKNHLRQSRNDHEIKQREDFITRRKGEIAQAAADPKSYPHLARLAPTRGREIADQIAEMMTEAHAAGSPISDAEALAALEAEIARVTAPDLEIRAPNGAQKPVVARSTPGRSISPSLTTKVASVRDMTEAERLEDLGKDIDFLRGLGLPV